MRKDELISKRTRASNKNYTFQNHGNPRIISEYWFQSTPIGKTLFLVFYTQACRYSRCLGCNLPSKMSEYHIDFTNIMRQVDSVFDYVLSDKEKKEIKKIIVSNNGSVLDEQTFSTTSLIYLIAKINATCPNVEVVSLETRPEYVDIEELEVISRSLCEGKTPTALEIAIGIEAHDDTIRNKHFMKGLEISALYDLAEKLHATNQKFLQKKPEYYKPLMLKAYFMLKPTPGLSDEEAIQDIQQGIDFLDSIAKEYKLEINMHLNPTYVAKGTLLEEEFRKNRYQPPSLDSVRKAVLHGKEKKLSFYIGLYDEGLAVEGGSFLKSDTQDIKLFKLLDKFNQTQDFESLLH